MPRLDYTLKGIKRIQAQKGGSPRSQLPITPSLLRMMKGVWAPSAGHDQKMIWAACCLAFFGFLRIGEMTVPDGGCFDPSVHLGVNDIALNSVKSPSFLRVTIKQSKTDPFRRGVELYLGRSNSDVCPVAAILSYLTCRGTGPGPLFRREDGRGLTRSHFVSSVRSALEKVGLDQSAYCGHSFRIGAATTAAVRGIMDSIIKTLGRWESLAYLQYVRIPRQQLIGYSSVLGASDSSQL